MSFFQFFWIFSFVVFPIWMWRYYLYNEKPMVFKGKIKSIDTSDEQWIIELDNGIVFSWSGQFIKRRRETSNGWHWEIITMTKDEVEEAYEEGKTIFVCTIRYYLDEYLDGKTAYPKVESIR